MAKQTKNTTDTSRKGDFSPLKEGTREFNEAVVARKELLNSFGSAASYKGTSSVSSSSKKIQNRKDKGRKMGEVPNYSPRKARTQNILAATSLM